MNREERIAHYMKFGWAPAPQDHLSDKIKDVLGQMGLEPHIKQCFANCQQFMRDAQRLGMDVEYHEGWVVSIIPIEHAWLKVDGELVDITLDPAENEYLNSLTYTREEIIENILSRHMYTPLTDNQQFFEISPWSQL